MTPHGTPCGSSSRQAPRLSMLRTKGRHAKDDGVWYPRWFWPSFAAPGAGWLLVLFAVPFYVVLSAAFRTVDPIVRHTAPLWNPIQWCRVTFRNVLGQIFGKDAFLGPPF